MVSKYIFRIVTFTAFLLCAQTSFGQDEDQDFFLLHQKIFSTRCAVSACHDGSFEPDFRTVQSAYYTLVYHPIIKNDAQSNFKYRVMPFDTSKSLLYERLTNCCFVNDGDQMPFADENLSQEEINDITSWILSGAPDWKGTIHKTVDNFPTIDHQLIVRGISSQHDTLDIMRKTKDNIRQIPENITVLILKIKAKDDFTPPEMCSNARLNFYKDVGFHDLEFSKAAIFQDGLWTVIINKEEFEAPSEFYIQFEINDGVNEENAKLPPAGFSWHKLDWAFRL